MGLESTADAHGVLLLNSNAMGERNTDTDRHMLEHMSGANVMCRCNQPLLHDTPSHSVTYEVHIYV